MTIQNQTLTFVLAGGVGSRLFPLTADRSKPAAPFGGKYRIIDFTLTNCLHSGLRRVLVLTQYKSHSLNKHLRDGWSVYNPELGEYITAVPAQMNEGKHWYQGTADAIFQNLNLLERSDAEYTLILSGDHIYRMDYAALLEAHKTNGAEVTIACMEVPVAEASAFGVVGVDENLQIKVFEEKPEQPTPLPGNPETCLVSMGLYVFSTQLLRAALLEEQQNENTGHDFGHDILPKLLQNHHVQAYRFGDDEGRVTPDRYWRDVGTIEAYYQANMDLLEAEPPLDLYQNDWPIRTYHPQSPPARTIPGSFGTNDSLINSILASGVVVAGGNVQHSILFRDAFVGDNATVSHSLLFDNVRVGEGAELRNCIVDKNVNIPASTRIGVDPDEDKKRFTVSEGGIVVVPKGYVFE